MIAHYLKIAYRNLLRNKVYSLINITGFAIGLSAAIFIILYIRFEITFDDFHDKGDRIVRASFASLREGVVEGESPAFTPPFGPAAAQEVAEVESYVRLSTPRIAYATLGEESFKLERIRHADSTFFQVFSFTLVRGNANQALTNPYSIVLTQTTAARLFGEKDPMGATMLLDGKGPYRVTGVAEDPPSNSSIEFSSLISFSTLYQDKGLYLDWNGGNQYIAYLLLHEGARLEHVEQLCRDLLWRNLNSQLAQVNVEIRPMLQPLKQVHLNYDEGSESLRANIAVFSTIGVFVLILACVNFVNLTTARAIRRAKEVGIRKTFGAARGDLVLQFLGEAILVTLAGMLIAVFFVELSTPWYRSVVGEHVRSLNTFGAVETGLFFLFILLVGIAAGSYPAFHLSGFRPSLLQGRYMRGTARSTVRNLLVFFQFTVSIGLIVCTLLTGAQLKYVQSKDLGFKKENVVVLSLRGDATKEKADVLKSALATVPGVLEVTASSEVPGTGFTSNGYFPEGHATPMMIHVVDTDDGFLSAYGLSLSSGRFFSTDIQSDKNAYVINESLAQVLGWSDPLNKTIRRGGDHPIIGVVKDFHFSSLRDKIEPLIITNHPWRDQYSVLSVRTATSDVSGLINGLSSVWAQIVPLSPFEFSFLDEQMNTLYYSERRFEELFFSFSLLAIVIALMGLLGLASFSTEQRTKEIGIRKVLGASARRVVTLLSKDFLKPVAAANIIAWPAAYFFIRQWLESFAYRTEIPWSVFLLAGGSAFLVALFVVSVQAVRAANANPVESLRYE